ncbi:CopG family transcriptional regulator [Luteimonas sp. gir]|uniref:CopG family transcriptional regulator n=1 Tax=Luteimonas sp. gir TaxID=3127960 RepID=UPI003075B55A
MSTTTIRLPSALKARVEKAAEQAGKGLDAFIMHAIAKPVELDGRHADFDAVVEARYARLAATGHAIPWDNMRTYLEAVIAGEQPEPLVARHWKRE